MSCKHGKWFDCDACAKEKKIWDMAVGDKVHEIESLRARVAELEADNKEMNSHLSRIGAILDDVDYLGEHSVGVQALKNRVAKLEAQEASEPVATICMPDPDDERDGVRFNLKDWEKLNALPAGTKLYTTTQPTKQEASKPVCWITPDGVGWRMRFEPPANDVPLGWTPLYETPQPTPTVQAAVAAALRKAAEVCQIVMQAKFEGGTAYDALEAILAIPHDDSALREICTRVADETKAACRASLHPSDVNSEDMADRILGEKK